MQTNEKINGAQKMQTLPMVHSGPHALEVTNLNAVTVVPQLSKCLNLRWFGGIKLMIQMI